MVISIVTGKNQLTLPAKLARLLDIHPGSRIQWEVGAEGTLVLRPLPSRSELAARARGMGMAWLKEGDSPVAELLKERMQDDD